MKKRLLFLAYMAAAVSITSTDGWAELYKPKECSEPSAYRVELTNTVADKAAVARRKKILGRAAAAAIFNEKVLCLVPAPSKDCKKKLNDEGCFYLVGNDQSKMKEKMLFRGTVKGKRGTPKLLVRRSKSCSSNNSICRIKELSFTKIAGSDGVYVTHELDTQPMAYTVDSKWNDYDPGPVGNPLLAPSPIEDDAVGAP